MTARVLSWGIGQLQEGHSVAIASVLSVKGSVPGKVGARLAISSRGGEPFGTVGGAGLELKVIEKCRELLSTTHQPYGELQTYGLNKGAKGYEVTPLDSLCGGQVTISFEILIPTPHILLLGAGHCAKALAPHIHLLGWEYSVHDSRTEYANRDMFPDAKDIFCSSVEDFFSNQDGTNISKYSEILLLGHDWKEDETRLLSLLSTLQQYENEAELEFNRPHIGVIGSRSKWNAFEKSCLEKGISPTIIERVQCPIGLNIGAESPEEIAIAVLSDVLSRFKNIDPSSTSWRTSYRVI
jgi:xanthine dehydrogenase accessory factor